MTAWHFRQGSLPREIHDPKSVSCHRGRIGCVRCSRVREHADRLDRERVASCVARPLNICRRLLPRETRRILFCIRQVSEPHIQDDVIGSHAERSALAVAELGMVFDLGS